MNTIPESEAFLNKHRAFRESYGPQSVPPDDDAPADQQDYESTADDHPFAPHDEPVKPKRGGKGPLPLVYFDDLGPMLDARDFVQGVLLENSSVVVYGESNSGKTFWCTDLSLHVAAGLEWNGKRVEQGGVVYCVLEGGQGFYNRVVAWRQARGRKSIPFAAIPSQLNLLDPHADTERLITAVNAAAETMSFPIKLIVIDTLSRALAGGNENAPDDMGALVMNMDRIRQETGAAVLFVHHSGKDQTRGARGWSGLRAAIDTEIEVIAFEGDEKEARLVKQRDMKKDAVFQFSLDVQEVGRNRHGEAVTTCLVQHGDVTVTSLRKKKKKLTGDKRAAVETLQNLVIDHGQLGMPGAPDGVKAVHEDVWRDKFLSGVMPGRDYEAKRKAFWRASKDLMQDRYVAMAEKHVWLASHVPDPEPEAFDD